MIIDLVTKWNIRAIFYGLTISIGINILFIILEVTSNSAYSYYFAGALILYTVIVYELYTTSNYYHVEHKKHSNSTYELEKYKFMQYAHHFFLPTVTYVGVIFFGYLFQHLVVYFLLSCFAFFLFTILFENIFSFYKHKTRILQSTNFIYDAVNLFILFLFNAIFFRAIQLEYISVIIGFLLIFLVNLFLFTLHSFRISHKKLSFVLSFIALIIVSLVGYLLSTILSSVILVAFILVVLYQLLMDLVNDVIKKTFNSQELLHHIIVILLIISLIQVAYSV